LSRSMTYPESMVGRPRCGRCLAVAFTALGCIAVAPRGSRADDIITERENLSHARIVGMSRGALDVRTADGVMRSFRLSDINFMYIDRGMAFADFNQAERMRFEGHVEQSLSRYRRAMRLTEGFWSDIVSARFLVAADQVGDLATAVPLFVRVAHGRSAGPSAAVRLFPSNLPGKRNGKVAAALGTLNAALGRDVDDAERTVLTLLRQRILQRIGEGGDAKAARRIAALSIPESVRTDDVYEAVYAALVVLVHQPSSDSEVLVWLDHAIRDCPMPALPGFLLLKGEVLRKRASTANDWIRASWPALRVAIHFPGDPRASIGYYDAAVALEHAGKIKAVSKLLHLCLDQSEGNSAVAVSARAMLERISVSQPDPE